MGAILVCFTRQALATVNHAARVTLTMCYLTVINQLMKRKVLTMAEHGPKPCPFCGDKGVVQRSGYCFRVCCSNRDCPIEPRTHWFSNCLSAIETWNRRKENW